MKVLVCFALAAIGCQAADYVLENDKVRVAVNDRAVITQLADKQSDAGKNLIVRPLAGFWKLIFHRGATYENVVEPQFQQHRVERAGDGLKVTVDRVKLGDETLDIRLVFGIRLEGDEVRWTARVENRAPVTIADLYFPQVGGMDPGTDDLIWPLGAGVRIRNVKSRLQPGIGGLPSIEEPVNAVADQEMDLPYPGGASMDWYELTGGRRGIYFASYDSRFLTGQLRVARLFQEGGAVQCSFSKLLFLKQGETWESGDYVVSPHPGTWHVGAGKYRRWADTWFRPQPKPAWVRQMKGMFLVILRQQYGDRMWTYSDLPRLYDEARRSGIDTVALFGWTEGGHDNKYPVYQPGEDMGGEAALRRGLLAIAKAGGHSILYMNGHIMDAGAPFFKEHATSAARTIWGAPYYEQYNKYHQSGFLKLFSRKLFAPACSGDPEWEKVMLADGRQLLGYGPSGVIYDQIGGMPSYPCFGNATGERESEAGSAGRRRLLTAIRANLKPAYPDFGFMAEHFTDIYAPSIDVLHGAGAGFAYDGQTFPQMSRYTFPEVIATQRHPAPRADRKQVNFALAYGFRFELEVRYRADVETIRNEEKTHLREYMRKVSTLRDRYWDLLGEGTFLDDQGLTNGNPALTATLFAQGGRRAVVVWNTGREPQPVRVEVPGKVYKEAAGGDGLLAARPTALGPQEVAVLVFE